MTEVVPASSPLAVLDRARAAIEKAKSLDELKEIRDQAEAARHYVKAAKMGKDMADRCAEIRLRAERRAGELLRDTADSGNRRGRGGDQKSKYQRETLISDPAPASTPAPPLAKPEPTPPPKPAPPPTLSDMGVSKNQSSRWQKLADVPDEVVEEYFTATKADDRGEITAVGLSQHWARKREPDEVTEPIPPKDGTYRCIVIDPPWPMKKIERTERPNQGLALDYPVLSLEQIADEALVPVRAHADDDCHLYLWVTHKFLPAGLELMEKWGFRYQCVMTWRKNVGITPFSWMYDTEHVLFGTRGNLPLERKGLRLSFEAPVQGHSVKPDVFYERVATASPGPRIDMFARRERDGFELWGNEVADVV